MSLKDNYIAHSEKFGGPYTLIKKGVSRSLIESIMRGSDPGAAKLIPVARLFGISVEELVTGQAAATPPATADKGEGYIAEDTAAKRSERAELVELIHNFGRLSGWGRSQVVNVLTVALEDEGLKFERLSPAGEEEEKEKKRKSG